MLSHLHLDPAKIEFSKKDEAEVEKIATSSGLEKQVAVEKQRLKMEYAGSTALNSLRSLKSKTETHSIHSHEGAYAAYENFVEHITSNPDCGVPIGFNYTILTQSEIEHLLKEMEKQNKLVDSPQV